MKTGTKVTEKSEYRGLNLGEVGRLGEIAKMLQDMSENPYNSQPYDVVSVLGATMKSLDIICNNMKVEPSCLCGIHGQDKSRCPKHRKL